MSLSRKEFFKKRPSFFHTFEYVGNLIFWMLILMSAENQFFVSTWKKKSSRRVPLSYFPMILSFLFREESLFLNWRLFLGYSNLQCCTHFSWTRIKWVIAHGILPFPIHFAPMLLPSRIFLERLRTGNWSKWVRFVPHQQYKNSGIKPESSALTI